MGVVLWADERVQFVLILLLAAVLGLTFWETRERQFAPRATRWWLSLVFLTHAFGYLALRGYGIYQDRKSR
jgi:hypothetical protein